MKNKINNKLLIVTTLSVIAMSGCVSKTVVAETTLTKLETPQWKPIQGKKIIKSKRDDCPDCFANISKITPKKIALEKDSNSVYSYDYSTEASDIYPENGSIEYEKYENPYLVDTKTDNSSLNSEKKDYLSKRSIQVGAFRKYAGAKVYAKRYSLLTSQYNVKIKKNVKDNKPIYRVQIEGFSNENEAKDFMERYGLNGAFLVSR